ncbi:MAG: SMC family ATPase, partial [Bacillota bacterium]|nr:SMC family ATPase [Bacillota bacterium]
MKPIYLEIDGLQSYKTLQKIDFEYLSENGLFGIFGSTGSGKSTVLDAITLALYGKVSRASRGTQGIMNNECDKMRVMFEFSFMRGGERDRYKIERIFGRKSDNNYETKSARLFVYKGEGVLPLAEKATDVDSAIIELTGLEYEDFTRAVVLPQNKFQEFLTLDKSKKLAMLERIFNLSEYGEKLNEHIKVKIYEIEKDFENIKGQLSAIEHA